MGFFDFLKPKPSPMNDMLAQMHAKIFPKGQKDMDAVTDALLYILDNKISRSEAQNIAVKSTAISRISKEFSKERLKQHLLVIAYSTSMTNRLKHFMVTWHS